MFNRLSSILHTNKSRYWFVVFILIFILIGWFYWFEYRPMSIRRFCYKTTYGRLSEQIKSNLAGDKNWKAGKIWMSNPMTKTINDDWGWWYPIEDIETRYVRCFLLRGMKPEKPLSQILNPTTF